ncbi:hypothetical protein Fcan01_22289 [Folsomia candida]|uniref:Uncharacterized protein n=1 Tax=Folsomia candida TaxID=158441 RepID=A0A226DCP0_FOLCA|nr:hypothetical protein Fcan01_22289 [Folsomia candida]
MLTPKGISAVCHLLDVGSGLKLFPFDWDSQEKCVKRAGRRHRFYFKIHKFINLFMNVLAAGRLMQAMSRGYFPLVLRILNTVWLMAYTLTTLCLVQFETKEGEILQFVNCLLSYVRRTSIRKINSDKLPSIPEKSDRNFDEMTESYEQKKLSYYIFFGMLMLAGNPFVHILLVDESPCAPHFVSSFFLPCEGFKNYYIPLLHKVPFMAAEYYLTTVIFFSCPLCGIRCAFEAITPLAVAGDVNDQNKEVVAKWKQGVVARRASNRAKKEAIAYQKSFHAVRCTAGSLYTFENSIVLCCLNNCMQLTLNLFLTFK